MCLDNKKLLSLETAMETKSWMYSRTQKKQHGELFQVAYTILFFNNEFYLTFKYNLII
jgi:gamma-glutamylcysteine synthetase